MIAVTGATGQLGQLVIQKLLEQHPASGIVALVRDPAKAAGIQAAGVQVRQADYNRPDTLAPALQGVDKLLLISSSEVGRRTAQHRAVIEAAKQAGVKLIAYTSLLHADTTPLALGAEHKETEALLTSSGIPYVLLRNGWYTENYMMSVAPALQHGVIIGTAGEGRIASASREDYALAAATVLSSDGHAGQIYELAGDEAYTLGELAAEIARQSGKPVSYRHLAPADFEAALIQVGVPAGMAAVLSDSEVGAAKGALFDDSHRLSQLIGRPSTPLAAMVKAALG